MSMCTWWSDSVSITTKLQLNIASMKGDYSYPVPVPAVPNMYHTHVGIILIIHAETYWNLTLMMHDDWRCATWLSLLNVNSMFLGSCNLTRNVPGPDNLLSSGILMLDLELGSYLESRHLSSDLGPEQITWSQLAHENTTCTNMINLIPPLSLCHYDYDYHFETWWTITWEVFDTLVFDRSQLPKQRREHPKPLSGQSKQLKPTPWSLLWGMRRSNLLIKELKSQLWRSGGAMRWFVEHVVLHPHPGQLALI